MLLIYISALIALLLTLILGVPYLDFLQKKMYNQYIREEGPASHQAKSGTPTMGGLIIIIPAIIAAVVSLFMAEKVTTASFVTIITTVLFCITGYDDDIKKIKRKQNKGISARRKLLFQILVALVPALYAIFTGKPYVSIFNLYQIHLGYFYPFYAIFIIIGTSNAVNLTDGLDGLAAGVSSIAFATMSIFCVLDGSIDLAIISAAFSGSCLAFLYYNRHPAKIFMGDTGSLALGGALGTLAILTKTDFWLLLIGIIYVIETLSVIIQVTSFKLTGKRVFKMAPIHHHFELLGWKEVKITKVFCFITFIFCLLAILLKVYMV